MNIDILIPTQSGVRHCTQILHMVSFVSSGGVFNKESLNLYAEKNKLKPSPLIQITKFEDNQMFIHDGMHRLCAIAIAGRKDLLQEEFQIKEFKYEDYILPNIEKGWITPFDPRTEVRIPDLTSWKTAINKIKDNTELLKFIAENRHLYVEKRNVHSIKDIVDSLEM